MCGGNAWRDPNSADSNATIRVKARRPAIMTGVRCPDSSQPVESAVVGEQLRRRPGECRLQAVRQAPDDRRGVDCVAGDGARVGGGGQPHAARPGPARSSACADAGGAFVPRGSAPRAKCSSRDTAGYCGGLFGGSTLLPPRGPQHPRSAPRCRAAGIPPNPGGMGGGR
jgi:hypothetical protein